MPGPASRDHAVHMLESALALDDTIDEQRAQATLADIFSETITPTLYVHGAGGRAHPILSRAAANRRTGERMQA